MQLGRPKVPEGQQVSARKYYLQGSTAKMLTVMLEQEYEMPVSLRTLGRWVAVFTSRGLTGQSAQWVGLKG